MQPPWSQPWKTVVKSLNTRKLTQHSVVTLHCQLGEAHAQKHVLGCTLFYSGDVYYMQSSWSSLIVMDYVMMRNTSAVLGGKLASHSATGSGSGIFLLVPFPLPRRVFTNTVGLEMSSSQDESLFSWVLSMDEFSSFWREVASFSSPCKTSQQ